MFGWRRKPEGFDWHKYVRTTILVRRQVRRDKLDQARGAAVEHAQAAGAAALRGAKAAGSAAKDGVVRGSGVAVDKGLSGLRRAFTLAGDGLDPAGQMLARGARPLMQTLQRSAVATPIALCGVVALAAGAFRATKFGFDVETIAPLLIGAALMLLAAPAFLTRFGITIPLQPKSGRGVALAAIALVVASAGAIFATRGAPGLAGVPVLGSLTSFKLPTLGAKPIEGRATAVSGDTLRIDTKLLRLSGIDAPDRNQVCTRQPGNKKWRCGETAQATLDRLVRGKSVRCEPGGTDDADRTLAKCFVDSRDVAVELASEGHVFATASLFGGYAFLEAEAKQKKSGIWSGEAERPETYRERLWEVAKKSTADGCPIKGRVTSSGKVYLAPWSLDYATRRCVPIVANAGSAAKRKPSPPAGAQADV